MYSSAVHCSVVQLTEVSLWLTRAFHVQGTSGKYGGAGGRGASYGTVAEQEIRGAGDQEIRGAGE